MNLVFIEAKNNNTSEYNFIKTVLSNIYKFTAIKQ
jgi:hypothetical protein